MTGGKNVFSYITTEDKLNGEFTMLEYLEKNSGVFNASGVIPKNEVAEMKERLASNKGNIWHGFISLNETDSRKIDTPQKSIQMIKQTFSKFLSDARFDKDNIDLMCALHKDKPHHLHIHFVFWEKEPKYKDRNKNFHYRNKGRIDKVAIDRMFVNLGLYVDDDKDNLYKHRDISLKELRGMTSIKTAFTNDKDIREEVISLSKDLPDSGRLTYGSKDMEAYRGRVDKIVTMLLDYDGTARLANTRFYAELEERERKIKSICGEPFSFANKNISEEEITKDLPKYHHKIDYNNINLINEIGADYKRRQGNLVLNLAKFIKKSNYRPSKNRKYKVNDNKLKRSYAISQKNIKTAFKKFLSSFGSESRLLERDFSHRLQEIEEEMKKEKEKYNSKEEQK